MFDLKFGNLQQQRGGLKKMTQKSLYNILDLEERPKCCLSQQKQ